MPKENIVVDFENQKIAVGPEYTLEKLGFTDSFKMIFGQLKETEFWKSLNGGVPMNVYFDKLKNGDPATVGLAAVSLLAGIAVAYGILKMFAVDEPTARPASTRKEPEKRDPPRDFTLEQLREYDGTNNKPIYVGLCREVFDVTAADSFYGVGNAYHCFAGREATRAMAKLSFEEADLASLKDDDFGGFEKQTLEDWYNKFKHYKQYPVVGKVSIPPEPRDFTKAELLATKDHASDAPPAGRVDAPLYLAINGKVLDVSYGGKEMYGPDGPYYRFVGIDASRALARMSFEPADLASSDLSDLTPEQQKTLADWERKFLEVKKYPVVGRLVD
jgi:membrane-associated progesterone receptor component